MSLGDGGSTGKRYFSAICYEGYRDGQMPGGTEPTCAEVQQDLAIIGPYTHGIRTYGSNPADHDGMCIPGIADQMNLDLHMGVWIDDTYTDDVNYGAIDASIGIVCGASAGQNGCPQGPSVHPSIKTFIVGNEYLLRVQEAKGNLVTSEARLVAYIKYARARIPSSIEVVTSDSYPTWLTASAALYNAVDSIVWQSHPFWESISIDMAAAHFATTHQEVLSKMQSYGITKPERCGETGWPWADSDGAAVGSEANQAQYLKDLNAYAFGAGLEYWFFEGFDESWKSSTAHTGSAEGDVGGKWGMWQADRTMPPHQIIQQIATLIPASQEWP